MPLMTAPPTRAAERMAALQAEMKGCVRCDLSVGRTQVVPGDGDPHSAVMLVGHGPGGTDDATGLPYTGPGGELLDELLEQAGIDRARLFLTNLVKCWPWKQEFGRRVNRTPAAREVKACAPAWLRQELELVRPRAIVCLGGPTAQHFLGKDFKITRQRGEWLPVPPAAPVVKLIGPPPEPAPVAMAILQPAYLIHLREHAPESFPGARQGMLHDLAKVKAVLEGLEPQVRRAGEPDAAPAGDEIPF